MLPAVAATPSLRTVKSMAYRGGTKLWSNRYHFSTTSPINDTNLSLMLNALVAAEAVCFPSSVEIVQGIAYLAGSDLPEVTNTYTTAGSLSTTGGTEVPGDCAAVATFSTDQRSTKNHPIYLFKYWHGVYRDNAGVNDAMLTGQHTLFAAFAASLVSGITFGGGVGEFSLAGPRGAAAQDSFVGAYIKHRDFV